MGLVIGNIITVVKSEISEEALLFFAIIQEDCFFILQEDNSYILQEN